VNDGFEVRDEFVEPLDVAASSFRSSMPTVIVAVDQIDVVLQKMRKMQVAPAVFRKTMHDDDGAVRVRRALVVCGASEMGDGKKLSFSIGRGKAFGTRAPMRG
jgi:hypothetical protein